MRKLFAAKLAMGGFLALLGLATLGGLLYLGVLQSGEPVQDLAVPVQVIGPGDDGIYAGIVAVSDATPYEALRAAARDGNFTVRTTDDGDRILVDEVAGHRNDDTGRWTWAVTRDDGTWCRPDADADGYTLHQGQQVLWRWSDDSAAAPAC